MVFEVPLGLIYGRQELIGSYGDVVPRQADDIQTNRDYWGLTEAVSGL